MLFKGVITIFPPVLRLGAVKGISVAQSEDEKEPQQSMPYKLHTFIQITGTPSTLCMNFQNYISP